MKLEYGPPGAVGVKHLQYMSADEPDYMSSGLQRLAKPVGALAAATWVFAWATGHDGLRRGALGVSVGALLVGLITRGT